MVPANSVQERSVYIANSRLGSVRMDRRKACAAEILRTSYLHALFARCINMGGQHKPRYNQDFGLQLLSNVSLKQPSIRTGNEP